MLMLNSRSLPYWSFNMKWDMGIWELNSDYDDHDMNNLAQDWLFTVQAINLEDSILISESIYVKSSRGLSWVW